MNLVSSTAQQMFQSSFQWGDLFSVHTIVHFYFNIITLFHPMASPCKGESIVHVCATEWERAQCNKVVVIVHYIYSVGDGFSSGPESDQNASVRDP